ncbi:cation transport ATPase [Chitinivorax tropicus]|uniref:Cation transport ATPase n=1 Tax=Chitinivorax tropicus TaxID=714531 RepID=A0A840MQZ0_9PROT|nr:heavy metal-associated domain-containing protein [Chitinivorax tropicus]MBB5018613.1 cation transport ATPase [Chitinivorax tropicus]
METLLKVNGISNVHDERLLMNAVQDLPCIDHAEFDAALGQLLVHHQPRVAREDIRHAIEEAGFTVTE